MFFCKCKSADIFLRGVCFVVEVYIVVYGKTKHEMHVCMNVCVCLQLYFGDKFVPKSEQTSSKPPFGNGLICKNTMKNIGNIVF